MNEQAETKLSTNMPTIDRERRARRSARAASAALRLNAAVTAGENWGRGDEARLAASGGGVTAINRSASRDMAATPARLSTGAEAGAKTSVMVPLRPIFRHHSQTPALRGFFRKPRLNG